MKIIVIPKYPWVMALTGFVLAGLGYWVHGLFTAPIALPVDARLAGSALFVAGAVLAALGVYKARKIKYKRVKTTAAVFAALALVVIAIGAYHYYGAYSTRSFSVASGPAMLSGTLFLPRGLGPHPLLVFVHGTTDRLHAQGLVYADYLARHGVGMFVYDQRGTGRSTGNSEFTRLDELAADALACYRYLQSTGGIDSSEMGFMGESQGGVVAGMAAREAGDVSFFIGVSTPGLSLGEQMLYTHRDALSESGENEAAVNWAQDLRERIWACWPDYVEYGELYTELNTAKDYEWYHIAGLPPVLRSPQRQRSAGGSPFEWTNPDLNHDPLPVLAQLDCPMLFIYGAADEIVPVPESRRRLETVLGQAGIDYTIEVFEGTGHAMYVTDAERKSRIPKLPPDLLDKLGAWADEHIK